jgi:hypothetical protein
VIFHCPVRLWLKKAGSSVYKRDTRKDLGNEAMEGVTLHQCPFLFQEHFSPRRGEYWAPEAEDV